jgi:hypothetical protein
MTTSVTFTSNCARDLYEIEIFSLALPAFLGCWVAQAADMEAE